ncbi:MAG: hypothetical protein Q8O63_03850 [Hoeflea sp.]|nr:hypothetical protein [Hoeflea sp.]
MKDQRGNGLRQTTQPDFPARTKQALHGYRVSRLRLLFLLLAGLILASFAAAWPAMAAIGPATAPAMPQTSPAAAPGIGDNTGANLRHRPVAEPIGNTTMETMLVARTYDRVPAVWDFEPVATMNAVPPPVRYAMLAFLLAIFAAMLATTAYLWRGVGRAYGGVPSAEPQIRYVEVDHEIPLRLEPPYGCSTRSRARMISTMRSGSAMSRTSMSFPFHSRI